MVPVELARVLAGFHDATEPLRGRLVRLREELAPTEPADRGADDEEPPDVVVTEPAW